ncbi:MAG: GNAT family N-acetyltransferase [Candidatus Magasanikiibacteriota bacterium]
MNLTIEKYTIKNRISLMKLIDEFQDYLISIDDFKRLVKKSGFCTKYFANIIKISKLNNGVIYLAKDNNGLAIGYVVGIIKKENVVESLLHKNQEKIGRVIDLFVSENYRGQKVGYKLLNYIEKYFKTKKCDLIRIEVYAPNKKAHEFYKKCGYLNESIDVVKFI